MQDADRLLRAHRAGLSRLSQRQLSQLRAGSTACLQPDMDPSVCGLCGCWVRRCTCKAKDANGVTPRQPVAKYAEEGGLLGSLPTELTLTVALLLPASSLAMLARACKQLRLIAYSEDIWSALRLASPWAAQMSAHAAPTPKDSFGNPGSRLAMRQEAMVEARWRAAQWAQAALPLERCRAHERAREVACVTFHDGYLVLTALDPPALQLWRASTLTLAHALRGRSTTRFFCTLIEMRAGGADRLCALSCDSRERRGALRLWDVRTGVVLRRLASHPRRVLGASLCTLAHVLATTDEGGGCLLWDLHDEGRPPPPPSDAAASPAAAPAAARSPAPASPSPAPSPQTVTSTPEAAAAASPASSVATPSSVASPADGAAPPAARPSEQARARLEAAAASSASSSTATSSPPAVATGVLLVAELPPALGCEKGRERAAAAAAAQAVPPPSSRPPPRRPRSSSARWCASRGTPTG